MKYNLEQYKTLAERFNSKSFLGKLMLIKQNPDIFTLEVSDGNLFLRLEDSAMWESLDYYFSFPQFLSDKEWRDLFSMMDINLKII